MCVKCKAGESKELSYSRYENVSFGVPQGSCLGPLLFLISCNDLPSTLSYCKAILFADDTTIYKSHKNLRYLQWCVHEELKHLLDWFWANKLTLNLSQSCCMLFTPCTSHLLKFDLMVENVEIPIVNCTKFLGVWIDDKLNWRKHVNTLVLKIKRNIALLQQSCNFLDSHTKKIIYYAHIYSHVNYCLSVWGNKINGQQRSKIDNLLSKCVKIIGGNQSCNILHLPSMITLENCKFGYRLINNLLLLNVSHCALTDHKGHSLVKKHSYLTRNKKVPNQPKVQCHKYNSSIFCTGYREFVRLSTDIKESKLFSTFIKSCKKKLLTTKS